MTELFRDKDLHAEFREKGYVILPLLDEKEVSTLKQLYRSLERSGNDGFFTSMNLENLDDRRRVDARIKELVTPKVSPLLPGHRPLLGNFTIKAPEGDSELRLHLDWSVVDERRFRTIGVWIPLEDVDEHNGALGVMEGSHRIGFSRRGSMVNFVAYEQEIAPEGFLAAIKERFPAKLLCLRAGTAVIYDLSLAHFSPPNHSPSLRLATNLMMIPEAARPLHYYRRGDKVLALQVDDDFFVTRNMSAPPDTDRFPLVEETVDAVEEQYGTEVVIGAGEYEIDRRMGPAPRSRSEAAGKRKRAWWRSIFAGKN